MYHRFRWTSVAARRNGLIQEYEPLQPFLLMALAERAGCRTFVDVGANIGTYSIFASTIPSVDRILAYEANDDAAAELKRNVSLNGLVIDVRQTAVSSKPGRVGFGVVSRFAGNNSVLQTSIHSRDVFRDEISVEAVTLDRDLAGVPGPICFKIDVEGHEAAVIVGGREILANAPAVVQIEDYQGDLAADMERLGYFQLIRVGPDHYFSNIDAFSDRDEAISIYEAAAESLIASNHEDQSVVFQRGDFGLRLSGKAYHVAKRVAKRLIGRRL